MTLDATHDPRLRSWVESAQVPGCDFPIQNLPFGCIRRGGSDESWRVAVAIGDRALDLLRACEAVAWPAHILALLRPLAAGDLNALMAQPSARRRDLRAALSSALAAGSGHEKALRPCLLQTSDIETALPCRIGGYTDFYTGIHHAESVGRLFRPDNPLLPNYKWVPIGYHGRTSSMVVSGRPIARPRGQTAAPGAAPALGPSRRLDYELELGYIIGPGNAQGEPVHIDDAEEHLFGVALLNDWSARDIQAWEYQPLGPFLAKNFATTLSPWVVTLEALEPFRLPFMRPAGDPQPLPYLDGESNRAHGVLDISLETWLSTAEMRAKGIAPVLLASSRSAEAAYWTAAQLVAHHTVGGCNLQPGDVFGSGTMSGPQPAQAGSLLELSQGGKVSIPLPGGESRTFLEDGDRVVLRAFCQRPGHVRIGFGECAGTVTPAIG